ncbi:S26 family signal peptidase [Nocardioides sp. Soil774]|nr:S26 family signal peptidase [Nocardioides sp. Soil774]
MTSDDRGSASISTDEEPRSSRSGDAQVSGRKRSKRKQLPLWQETILLLAVALVLAIVIKTFFVQAFYIPSESMEPGLILNDRILIQKVSYWGGGEPERGDVVVFKDPGGWLPPSESAGPTNPVAKVMAKIGLYPTGGHLVKRVIGVAGDTIVCCDDKGRLSVNGEPLDEKSFVRRDTGKCDGPMPNNGSCEWRTGPIPEGHIFVMGDNRSHSADSSAKMCPDNVTECVPGDEFVPVDLVVGKVFVLLWPADRFRWNTRPDTFEDVPDRS